MTHSLRLVVFALTLAACDSPEDAGETSPSDLTGATKFACGRKDFDADVSLKFSNAGKDLFVEWGLDNIVTASGSVDPSYRPREDNIEFIRFAGFEGLSLDRPEPTTTILVEKPMLQGKTGRVKLQFLHPSGKFEQIENECTPVR